MQLWLDHLVICSSTLEEGTAWIEDQLQVTMHPGGTHPAMATHNSLLRIGETSYLEVIAPNPTLPDPCRPRWFELDEPLQNAAAAFRSWVARTSDLAAAHRVSVESGCDPGPVEVMSRGALSWQITIPHDGKFVEGGRVPSIIQWPESVHPADRLPMSSVRLKQLVIRYSPSDRFIEWANRFVLDPRIVLHARKSSDEPLLEAIFITPAGEYQLVSGRR